MNTWSLPCLFNHLHRDVERELGIAREGIGHPGAKGDASEKVWLQLFQTYLPARYRAEAAFVVDSDGKFSDQIDVVIFDRQYSPFIFHFKDQKIVPAESVYAVFESKQSISASVIRYACEKVASVRKLNRTSLPIPHAGGIHDPKSPPRIFGGVLALESEWNPGLGDSLLRALRTDADNDRLDLGCVAAHGIFQFDDGLQNYEITQTDKAATAFLLMLLSMLQFSGTVPMIDLKAYARWL